jgi:hypothetical protein
MALISDTTTKIFDVSQIPPGTLMFARHRSWQHGIGGFVTSITEKEISVQYYPGISNMTNHFFIPCREAAAGQWEMRWSKDLQTSASLGGDSDGTF